MRFFSAAFFSFQRLHFMEVIFYFPRVSLDTRKTRIRSVTERKRESGLGWVRLLRPISFLCFSHRSLLTDRERLRRWIRNQDRSRCSSAFYQFEIGCWAESSKEALVHNVANRSKGQMFLANSWGHEITRQLLS